MEWAYSHTKKGRRSSASPVFHPVHGRIHGGIHIHGLVAVRGNRSNGGARIVIGPDGFRGRHEVGAVAGLVAQGPEDDGGMVLGAVNHAHVALHVRLLPGGFSGNVHAAVADSVGLAVGFVDHVKAVAVAEVVEIGVVGIVGTAHGVDVVRLDDLYVLLHHLPRNGAAIVRMGFMAVDPLELDGLAVDQHGSVVSDFHGAESDVDGTGILPFRE